MHDMGELLYDFQLCDADAAGFTDAANIVAGKVYQHRMLGAFLFILQKVCHQSFVLRIIRSAAAGTGDRICSQLITRYPYQHLR